MVEITPVNYVQLAGLVVLFIIVVYIYWWRKRNGRD